jgi:hypothetical protein
VESAPNGVQMETIHPCKQLRSRRNRAWSGHADALRYSLYHQIAPQISCSLRPYSCASDFGSSLAAKREAITAVEIPVPSITDFPNGMFFVNKRIVLDDTISVSDHSLKIHVHYFLKGKLATFRQIHWHTICRLLNEQIDAIGPKHGSSLSVRFCRTVMNA